MALYNIDGWLTTLADNLHGLETAINSGYDHFQEIWLQELQALITRVEHTVVKCMPLAEDCLPDHDDLIIIHNLLSTLGWITLLTEWTASEDLGYNILHHLNSLANNLIGPSIPCPASAPAPGLAVLSLPPWVEFAPSHIWSKSIDCPHLESHNTLLEILLVLVKTSTCLPLAGPWEPIMACPFLTLQSQTMIYQSQFCWTPMHCLI